MKFLSTTKIIKLLYRLSLGTILFIFGLLSGISLTDKCQHKLYFPVEDYYYVPTNGTTIIYTETPTKIEKKL